MIFKVWDRKNEKYADDELEELGKEFEEYGLLWCDMEGVALQSDGSLVLMDECGRYCYLPSDRFVVHWEGLGDGE